MARKYKILHLVESLDAIGGMERIVAEIADRLNKKEYDVEVWCVHKGGKFAEELQRQGLVLKIFKVTNCYDPLSILKLARAMRQAKADVVHTHLYFASTIGRLAGKIAGVKVLINHVHSSYWHYSRRNLFVERQLSKITDKIICVSSHTMDFVIKNEKIAPSKVEVIYNGISRVNTPSKVEARKMFNVQPQHIIIISVANLLENKGHKVLLKALSLLEIQKKEVMCWIVGQGPMEGELKDVARQLCLDPKIIFWGERHDIPQLLTASDIFVLASIHREGLSISVLEAFAYQVPVIATKVGGLPEVINDKVDGIKIAPDDPVALAAAIEDLILSRDKRAQFAQAGFKKFEEQFDVNIMISRIEKLYKECLKPNG